MKKQLILLGTILCFTFSAFAQESKPTQEGDFFAKTGRPFVKAYNAIEHATVAGYKAIESGVVDGYKTVENAVVKTFTDSVSISRMYRKGYMANVELLWTNLSYWGISTSHGFGFGNGLYVGGGVGFGAELTKATQEASAYCNDYVTLPKHNWQPTYFVSAFADVKYSFINRLASPYVALNAGAYGDLTNVGIKGFVNPSIGVDISRFSISVGYEYQIGLWQSSKEINDHHVKCAIGFTF